MGKNERTLQHQHSLQVKIKPKKVSEKQEKAEKIVKNSLEVTKDTNISVYNVLDKPENTPKRKRRIRKCRSCDQAEKVLAFKRKRKGVRLKFTPTENTLQDEP